MINPKQKQFYITQLPQEAIAILSCLFSGEIESYENAYMAEVKLDKPLEHIKNGGDGFIIHTNDEQLKSSAKYLNDPNWVVVHKSDMSMVSDYEKQNLKRIAKEYVEKNL